MQSLPLQNFEWFDHLNSVDVYGNPINTNTGNVTVINDYQSLGTTGNVLYPVDALTSLLSPPLTIMELYAKKDRRATAEFVTFSSILNNADSNFSYEDEHKYSISSATSYSSTNGILSPSSNNTNTDANTSPDPTNTNSKECLTELFTSSSHTSPDIESEQLPGPPCNGLDYNGRKPRKWKNRKYKCSHCDLSFYDKDLHLYADHVEKVEKQKDGQSLTRRKYKCAEPTCPWHKIGFLRKLEAQKHFVRKHGVPKFECRFWCADGEKFPGAGICTTRWHADSGNRSRHEHAIHGAAFEKN